MSGVYVHVPFCRKRCPYCAFVLVESDGSLHEPFVEKVCRELRREKREVSTLYFGGGTPSILGAGAIGRLVEAAGGRPSEVTVECNPDGLRLEGFREAGVNRITLGVQALDDGLLRFLGRGHGADEARRAWREASRVFDNVCVDLIFGVPGQALEGWRRTLEEVRSWGPAHVSLYGLTYEPGTPFGKLRDRIPEETERAMYEAAMDALTDYRHYEISNFARPGFESRHNWDCWTGKPYVGFGPGAHSYSPPERWWNLSNVKEYLRREDVVMRRETLTPEQVRIEGIFLGLRTDRGVELDRIPEDLEPFLERADGRVRLTRAGKCVADSVIRRLL
jgi:oxygen-independent coproporphyrinogen-3 oxidase